MRISALAFAIMISAVLAVATTSALITYYRISNLGKVKTIGVGVYWDSACTNKVSSIDWGAVEAGSSKNVTVYIRNEGNSAANLSLSATNWNPATASNYISLRWDYNGQQVSANQVIKVTLILTVSSSIRDITSFTFDITISSTS